MGVAFYTLTRDQITTGLAELRADIARFRAAEAALHLVGRVPLDSDRGVVANAELACTLLDTWLNGNQPIGGGDYFPERPLSGPEDAMLYEKSWPGYRSDPDLCKRPGARPYHLLLSAMQVDTDAELVLWRQENVDLQVGDSVSHRTCTWLNNGTVEEVASDKVRVCFHRAVGTVVMGSARNMDIAYVQLVKKGRS